MESPTSPSSVSREAALLWALHARLQRDWTLAGASSAVEETRTRLHALVAATDGANASTNNINAMPSVLYARAPMASTDTGASELVEVRAIAIHGKLFVHFVSPYRATRLDLAVDDYVKSVSISTPSTPQVPLPRGQQLVGAWRVNTEMLSWRLERNVFSLFDTDSSDGDPHLAAAAAAELGRLPEPLLLRLAPFLHTVEYGAVTQTNRYLRELADNASAWQEFLRRDFHRHPDARPSTKAKSAYLELRECTRQRAEERRLMDLRVDLDPDLDRDALPAFFTRPMHRPPMFGDLAPPPPFVGTWQRGVGSGGWRRPGHTTQSRLDDPRVTM